MNRFSFRPSVENLEAREMMTTGLAAMPAMKMPVIEPAITRVAQQVAQPTVAKSQAATSLYSAYTVTNNTHFNLTFSIRWYDQANYGGGGSYTTWKTYTLKPGYRETFYIHDVVAFNGCLTTSYSGEKAQIYFATNTSGRTQIDNLSSTVVSGVPTVGAGSHYQFLQTSSTTLNLYTGG